MVGKLPKKPGTKARRRQNPLAEKNGNVPGPSSNPETNLILADIGLRAVSRLARRTLERKLLSGYGRKQAKAIVKNRNIGKSLANSIIARLATRSLPGAMLIGAGLLAKTLLDRSHNPKDKGGPPDEADKT